ncbi:MAG: DUF308 domain-containing protein [Betaproteobacteria bacterium]
MDIPAREMKPYPHAVDRRLHVRWRCLQTQAIMMIVLGAVAMTMPVVTTFAVGDVIGGVLFIGGVWRIVAHIRTKQSHGFNWYVTIAVAAVVLGAAMLAVPPTGIRVLTSLLFAFFLIEGVAKILFALDLRAHAHEWGWAALAGALDLCLAVLIAAGWPATAAWTMGLLVGINMLCFGLALTAIALAARRARERDRRNITSDHYVSAKETSRA